MHFFFKACEYKANCKGNINPPKEEKGKKERRARGERRGFLFFFVKHASGTYLSFPDLARWDGK